MTRYQVCPFVPPDQIGFSKAIWEGDDSEEAAGVIQRHLPEYEHGLLLVDRETCECMLWRA